MGNCNNEALTEAKTNRLHVVLVRVLGGHALQIERTETELVRSGKLSSLVSFAVEHGLNVEGF